jgi:cell division transport system permease protein
MRANFVLSGVAAGIRRNVSMTIALVLSTSIALAFVGAALLANTEITKFKRVYEGKINVSVYLCAQNEAGHGTCAHKTTPAEQTAIETQLNSDPAVKSAAFVSEQQQYDRGREIEGPAVAKYLKVGDLPASFTVKLNDLK